MDLLYFLETRLRFVEQLYDSTLAPFEETKRKIDKGEAPYVDKRDPEYAEEPAFLEEWQQADDSVVVIGHWCLCMVQASLAAYLQECIGPRGSYWWDPEQLSAELGKKKQKERSWFQCYQLLFLEDLGIDWNKGPISVTELEQLNLTRNDIVHNMDVFSTSVARVERHAKLYPTGLFTDKLGSGLGMERIKVDKTKLQQAISLVHGFCTWLDGIRCNYPTFMSSQTTTP
jgi:hypothetical protein